MPTKLEGEAYDDYMKQHGDPPAMTEAGTERKWRVETRVGFRGAHYVLYGATKPYGTAIRLAQDVGEDEAKAWAKLLEADQARLRTAEAALRAIISLVDRGMLISPKGQGFPEGAIHAARQASSGQAASKLSENTGSHEN